MRGRARRRALVDDSRGLRSVKVIFEAARRVFHGARCRAHQSPMATVWAGRPLAGESALRGAHDPCCLHLARACALPGGQSLACGDGSGDGQARPQAASRARPPVRSLDAARATRAERAAITGVEGARWCAARSLLLLMGDGAPQACAHLAACVSTHIRDADARKRCCA